MKKTVKKESQKTKKLLINLAIHLMFFVGVMTMLYPFYINTLNNYIDDVRVTYYKNQENKRFEEQKKKLADENRKLAENGLTPAADPFDNENTKTVSDAYYKEHLIGTITIPKIHLEIPLFDTTNSNLLELGATVLNGTSYPLGGENTHSVISAHRGLPNRELFTDLPDLDKGDVFILDVLGQKLAYEVVTIETVEPHETDVLKIEPGKDLVTLLTCTPYMINSHRLLVTGSRVPYTPEVKEKENQGLRNRLIIQIMMTALMVLLVILMIWLLYRLIHQYLLSKQQITLKLCLYHQDGSPMSLDFILFDRKGKKRLKRQKRDIVVSPNANGYVEITNLPKNLYVLKDADGKYRISLGQRRLRRSDIVVKPFKKSPVKVQENQDIITVIFLTKFS